MACDTRKKVSAKSFCIPAGPYPAHLSTEAESAKVKQLRIVDNNEIIREDTSDM